MQKVPASWQQILRTNFTHWEALADFLELAPEQRAQIDSKPRFALNLPVRLAQKIAKSNLEDPILKQFLPTKQERIPKLHFVKDPVGDCAARQNNKLLNKYQDRVLLLCTSACAMHCRFCFRQHFDYETEIKSFDQEIKLIRQDDSIHEVILSGGDPLSLSNQTLKQLLDSLSAIPHINRIRFHSRFPIGIPERIEPDFLEMINQTACQIWFVLHCNHPRELDAEVIVSLKQLQKQGAVLLNQTVLLRGVNDSLETLKLLSEALVNQGIVPYYLHQLDPVAGAAHFEVDQTTGTKLMQELSTQLAGYAIPRYVKEVAGEPSKSILF